MSCRYDPSCQAIIQAARDLWLRGVGDVEGCSTIAPQETVNNSDTGTAASSTSETIRNHSCRYESEVLVCSESKCASLAGTPPSQSGVATSIMARVESMYRQVLLRNDCSCCELRDAREKLSMILLQSGRYEEAGEILSSLGFTCRLASRVLDYGSMTSEPLQIRSEALTESSSDSYCRIFDNVLPEKEFKILQDVFSDVNGSYWTDHEYTVEPPSPYYSYVLPLAEPSTGTMYKVIGSLKKILQRHFPALKSAASAEMWAHNRPHATGHQFHFDSDNEGCTEIIRNPIVSCVVYLSDSAGGPTVVTNQRLSSRGLASSAWMVPATKSNRLVAFDGKLLHGVIPGAGSSPNRRVSLMIAFWRTIRIRQTKGSAACQWPDPGTAAWSDALMVSSNSPETCTDEVATKEVQPISVSPVYETVPGGEPWTRSKGMPDYELLFQGM